jgi:transcriptional regulator with XRE-family HTH domain
MPAIPYPVELKLPEKLKNREYRRKFFLAEASARIAAQLIALRKRRGLNQKQVAELTNTRQPAISRAEQSDYQNWSFNTLRAITDALDARIRVVIEPSEDVLREYDGEEDVQTVAAIEVAPSMNQAIDIYQSECFVPLQYVNASRIFTTWYSRFQNLASSSVAQSMQAWIKAELLAKDAEIAKLKEENARLRNAALMAAPDVSEDQITNPMAVFINGNRAPQRVAV